MRRRGAIVTPVLEDDGWSRQGRDVWRDFGSMSIIQASARDDGYYWVRSVGKRTPIAHGQKSSVTEAKQAALDAVVEYAQSILTDARRARRRGHSATRRLLKEQAR